MAVKYARAGGGNWTADATWSTTSGGAADTTKPTAADDARLDASSGAVTVDSGAVCRSLDCNGYTGTLTHTGGPVLTIGDGTAGAGNIALRFSAGMTYTVTSAISFVSTSTTQQTIDFGGKTTGNWTIVGVGSSYLLSTASTTGSVNTVTLTSGILNTNGQACSWGGFSSSGALARTLTLGASAITITGSGTAWDTSTTTNLTFNANTSTITMTNTSCTFSGGGLTYNNLVHSGVSVFNYTGANLFNNFTLTGSAIKTAAFGFNSASITCSGTFTCNGNSATNRLIASSIAVGTARTITAAAVSLSNTDFQDITGAGAATWTGTSLGDCGGNSGITFTTPVTQTHTASTGGNWSDVTKWTSRVPLPQDNVIVDGNTTGTLTADMPRLGADLTMTGFAGTFTNSISVTQYGSLTLASGQTFTTTPASYNLAGRSSHTITMSGKSFGNSLVISAPSGTYTMQDAFSSIGQVTLSNGSLVTGGFSFTASNFVSTGTATRAITLSTSTVTLTSTATLSTWSVASTGLTLSAASSTIVFSAASTNTRTFAGAGLTYGTLTYTVANSPGSLTITGANTFNTLNIGSGRIVTMPSSTTNTITNSFNVNGVVNGYVYLPGVASNYASAPDSASLSITGDITIDIKIAADDWTPASNTVLAAKYGSASTYSYLFYIDTTGKLTFVTSTDGTTGTLKSSVSSVATGVTDGAVKWVRASRDVDDGAGNFVTKFYTSDDGSTWTQLGTTQTSAGNHAIFDSTAVLEIGSYIGGTAPVSGKLYNAKVYGSYLEAAAGTPVFNADFTTKPVGSNTMSESSGNTAAFTGSYLRLPGVSGNFASAPDTAALSITGDIDLRVRLALDDWTPAATATILSKEEPTTQRSYLLQIGTGGQLFTRISPDGSSTAFNATASVATGISDGATGWVRMTWRASDGRVQFFKANGALTNPVAADFTQLGTDQTANAGSIFNSTGLLTIGARGNLGTSEPAAGNFYRAQVRNGIDGTLVYDADFTTSPSYARTLTESSANAATVTLNGGVTINGTLAQAGDGRVSIVSSSAGTAATLTSRNEQSARYLSIQDSTVDASPTWYAGATSTNVSGNTNWVFTDNPDFTVGESLNERRTGFILRSYPALGTGSDQDLWLRYLVQATGATGTETDLTYIFLRQKGGSGEKLSGLWRSYLNSKGYSSGTVHDDMMALFASGTQT